MTLLLFRYCVVFLNLSVFQDFDRPSKLLRIVLVHTSSFSKRLGTAASQLDLLRKNVFNSRDHSCST